MIERALSGLAGLVLLAMMLLTAVDVAGRYLFDAPVRGGYEITTILLAVLIFLALPLVCGRDEHIVVDVLDHAIPEPARLWQTRLVGLLSALVLIALAWQLYDRGLTLWRDGGMTNTLRLPLAPVAFLMAAMAGLSALVVAARAWRGR